MRLLMVVESPDRSEAHVFRALRQEGHEVEVVCDPGTARLSELKDAGLVVHEFPVHRRVDMPAIRFLRERMRSQKTEIVHAFYKRSLGNVLVAARGLKVRIVTYRGIVGNLHRWDPQTRMTFMNRRVRRIVCVCDAVRDSLLDLGIPPRRLVTIYKGHKPAWYDGMPPADLRQFGVPEGAFVVTCVAKIRPRKGVDDLVRAARLIPDESVHFLIVGDVTDSRVPATIRELGLERRVHLTGFLRNAASVTGCSHVFAMPSLRREGLPRAVIEAMAQRVPPVVTEVGGMPELVKDGESGLVVPPGNPAAIAESIARLRRDEGLRLSMGTRARERIQTHFNVNTTVTRTLALYREVLEERD